MDVTAIIRVSVRNGSYRSTDDKARQVSTHTKAVENALH